MKDTIPGCTQTVVKGKEKGEKTVGRILNLRNHHLRFERDRTM